MNGRIIGIDIARAIAIFGMIIVNFKIALGSTGGEFIKLFNRILEGKAAATFVVLAGVGIALMSNSALKTKDNLKLKRIKLSVIKKSLFLFILGISYTPIWPADILHFYGLYMLITLLFLRYNTIKLLSISTSLILIYPIILTVWNYETGWDFSTFEYNDFWTINGFTRNLFINGFHPVLPWTAFMLIGLWFGRQNLNNTKFIKRSIIISSVIYLSSVLFSYITITSLSEILDTPKEELTQIFGTSPMPPLPIYMISASSIAIFTISICIIIGKTFQSNRIVIALSNTGKLALTFYIAHVIIGMGVIEMIHPTKIGSLSIEFTTTYALLFSALSIIFASFWMRHFKLGPVEWIMRKLTN